ncbi:hypothetical protein Tco_1436719 [Tanacetum coccineum]
MIGNRSQLVNFVSKFLGTVRFGNDHIEKIMGYEDDQMGNVIISQPMFDEYLNPLASVDSQVPAVVALELANSTSTPSSTTIDQDTPSTSTSQTPPETPSLITPLNVKKADHDIKVAHMDNDPYFGLLIPEPSFEGSYS